MTMKVKDCMRADIPSVNIGATFHHVKEKMLEEETSVVVVKDGEKIVGMITDMDVFSHAASGKDPGTLKVEAHMSACEFGGLNPCLQVFKDSPIEDAIRIMATSGVHHLLVWGKDGRLSGVISSNDILKTLD